MWLEGKIIKWKAPTEGILKINFEGSVIKVSADGGFVIRDYIGRPICSWSSQPRI